MKLTQDYLKAVLNYDPETGIFTWRKRPELSGRYAKTWSSRYEGKQAGCKKHKTDATNNYLLIGINRKIYRAHRLAWLYMTGEFPPTQIDHIDGNGLNNSFSNLRIATRKQNLANAKMKGCSRVGAKGVRKRGNSYQAYIRKGGKQVYLGSSKLLDEASALYERAAQELHGDYAYHKRTGA